MDILFDMLLDPSNLAVLLAGLLLTFAAWFGKGVSPKLVPALWTSLGILGTFIAIYLALKDGQVDYKNLNAFVQQVSLAFSTSIIGVVGSMITSVLFKAREEGAARAAQGQAWSRQDPRKVLSDLLHAQQETNAQLAEVGKQLALLNNHQVSLLAAVSKMHQTERDSHDNLLNIDVSLQQFRTQLSSRLDEVFEGMQRQQTRKLEALSEQGFERVEQLSERLRQDYARLLQQHAEEVSQFEKKHR